MSQKPVAAESEATHESPRPGLDLAYGRRMKAAPPGLDHRSDGLFFRNLFKGDDTRDRLNNHGLILATQHGFSSPIHHHNFEQFRYAWDGEFTIRQDMTIKEGEMAYHPEGAYYGPQNDDGSERTILVLQFGGASRQGYISTSSLQEANKELQRTGDFREGKWWPHGGGSPVDGYQALWETCNRGQKLKYPEPRYKLPVFISPDAFRWRRLLNPHGDKSLQNGHANGTDEIRANGAGSNIRASHKTLGTFTELQVSVQMLRLGAGGAVVLEARDAIQLLVVRHGSGDVEGYPIESETAIRLAPGTTTRLTSASGMMLLHWVLPTIYEKDDADATDDEGEINGYSDVGADLNGRAE